MYIDDPDKRLPPIYLRLLKKELCDFPPIHDTRDCVLVDYQDGTYQCLCSVCGMEWIKPYGHNCSYTVEVFGGTLEVHSYPTHWARIDDDMVEFIYI